MTSSPTLDIDEAQRLEAEYDPEMQFRPVLPPATWVVVPALVLLGVYHYYTAGFGMPARHWHIAIHMGTVMALVFLVFPATAAGMGPPRSRWWRPGSVPLYDWAAAAAVVAASLYIPLSYSTIQFRIGDPLAVDVAIGTVMVLLVLEGTRRSIGIALPLIAVVFILYGVWGNYAPGVLVHPGNSWATLINHIYLTTEGIFGIAAHVVATYVFHFVLFGVIAQRMGLGQFFIDIASCVAGRYSGGPAKVSVVASGLFGMISGSSIANTVSTGSLTIPAMKRIGYAPKFAAAVEATASTGGQITPPIMGAAAFLMIEFLEIPYTDIILAAIIPALLHYFGVLTMVHLEARKRGLRGLRPDELPRFWAVLRDGWPTVIPLIVLLVVLFRGHTPFLAAFYGITGCIVVGFLNPRHRLTLRDLWESFALGTKYALAVGAAAASIGIIVGVVTLSGMGFRIAYMIITFARDIADTVGPLLPLFTADQLILFLTLVLTAIACILLGTGLPTTATYIVLVAVAAPALAQLGVPPIATHFFVFYYGVLADITPPVAVAAYAGAAIANTPPFPAGNTAFRLANAKALVPLVFVYAPSMLIVVDNFSWSEFLIATGGATMGVALLGTALIGYMFMPMPWWQRWLTGVAALLIVAPTIVSTLIGAALVAPVLALQFVSSRRMVPRPAGAP